MARNHVNKPLKLTIYNSRQDEERQITIVPRTGWGGDGLLGCAIRSSPLEGVRDRVWHILVLLFLSVCHFVILSSFRMFTRIHQLKRLV